MIETGLQDKVVIVTGAAHGIGKATADRFAAEGARVASWDKQPGEAPANGTFQLVDVTDPGSIQTALDELRAQLGLPYALVNNAGILRDGQLVKFKDGALAGTLSDEQFDAVIAVNLKGVFNCTRAVAPLMIEGNAGGVILSATSVVALYGNFGQTNYIAAKAGVIGMTKVWARELGKYQIRANAVAPGYIDTEMIAGLPEKIRGAMFQHTPLGRIGSPQDIANAYIWLASDAASFITGAVLSVDGGAVVGT